jgi:hypothetical protein
VRKTRCVRECRCACPCGDHSGLASLALPKMERLVPNLRSVSISASFSLTSPLTLTPSHSHITHTLSPSLPHTLTHILPSPSLTLPHYTTLAHTSSHTHTLLSLTLTLSLSLSSSHSHSHSHTLTYLNFSRRSFLFESGFRTLLSPFLPLCLRSLALFLHLNDPLLFEIFWIAVQLVKKKKM